MSASTTPSTTSAGVPVLIAKTPSDLRDELTDMVIRDLLGPAGGPDEELNQYEDHVYQRYLVGMLAPKDSEIAGGELDELATGDGDEGEEGTPEFGVPAGSTYFPSSMGMSFVVAAETKEIVVEAEWGQYLRVKSARSTTRTAARPMSGSGNPIIAATDNLTAQGRQYRAAAAASRASAGAVAGAHALDGRWLGRDAFHGQPARGTHAPRRTEG